MLHAENAHDSLKYKGGIPQRLDTDVHYVVTPKTSTALWQQKLAQRCDDENEHSAVAVKTSTALWQRWC